MAEHVILFAGPMGVGKTTAIRSISEIGVVSTEADNTDRETADKPTTTVALDYGEIAVGEDEKVRLYGVPGQRRFSFMWRILAERAIGMILLVDNSAADPIADLLAGIDDFRELIDRGGAVVGLSRLDAAPRPTVLEHTAAIAAAHPGLMIPVIPVDPRAAGDVRLALMTLIATIEMRDAFRPEEAR